MSARTCLLMGIAAAALGLGLRLALPVRPADDAVRGVVAFYGSLPRR